MWVALEPMLFAGVLLGLRMLGLIMALPGIGTGAFPAPTRIILTLFLTVFCYSVIGLPFVPVPQELWSAAPMVAREFLVGAALGLTIKVFMGFADAGGALVGQFGSLAMASQVDPSSGHESTAVANLLGVVGGLALVSMDGHYLALGGLFDNLALFPLGGRSPVGFAPGALVQMGQGLFIAAMKVAAPVILVTTLVNVGMALLARAAPQLNIFSVGFAAVLLVTFSFLDTAVVSVSEVYDNTLGELPDLMNRNLVTAGAAP